MITRRNWLLRCSILINVAVLLYICSHLMIGNSNLQLGPAFVIQEDYAVKQPPAAMRPHVAADAAMLQGLDESGSNEVRNGGEVPSSSSGIGRNGYERQRADEADALPPEPDSNQVRTKKVSSLLANFHFMLIRSSQSIGLTEEWYDSRANELGPDRERE